MKLLIIFLSLIFLSCSDNGLSNVEVLQPGKHCEIIYKDSTGTLTECITTTKRGGVIIDTIVTLDAK